jgi:threonine/homoserine/homoserine lactone efflux protein
VIAGAVAFFLRGLALGFGAAATPGPFQAYLLAQSLRNGAGRTLSVALVPLASDPPVIAVVLAVLAQVPAGLLRALQILGGAIVLWLGVGAVRASRTSQPPEARTPPRGFLRAALLNFTNPNAWIFWSLVGGPILAEAWRAAPGRGLAFLAGFYLFLVGGNVLLVLAAGQAARLGAGFTRGLGLLSGMVLAAFGLVQMGRGIAGA